MRVNRAVERSAGQSRFDASAMDSEQLSALTVVVPNLHWRYSGVTATKRMVAPRLARLLSAGWFGSDAPEGVRRLTVRDIMRLRARAQRSKARIWHARRNNEMIIGLALRGLGWPFKLIFTSAAQRHKTWITRFLISRMDGVIATNAASASYLKRAATSCTMVSTPRLLPAGGPGGGICVDRLARPLRHRLLWPRAYAEGHRPVRRGDVRAAAEISGLRSRHRGRG
jgi:hypothetical protein